MTDPDLLHPRDDFDANDPDDLATLAILTGRPTGNGDHTPNDLLLTLRAVHAEMLHRQNSHRMLVLDLSDLSQTHALFDDPGPAGIEARHLARHINDIGYVLGVHLAAHCPANEADHDTPTMTQGTAPTPPRTVAAPCPPSAQTRTR